MLSVLIFDCFRSSVASFFRRCFSHCSLSFAALCSFVDYYSRLLLLVLFSEEDPCGWLPGMVDSLFLRGCVCVLQIKPFFLPVDIQHTQCPPYRLTSS